MRGDRRVNGDWNVTKKNQSEIGGAISRLQKPSPWHGLPAHVNGDGRTEDLVSSDFLKHRAANTGGDARATGQPYALQELQPPWLKTSPAFIALPQ
jgi:hypothetical protein